MCMFCRSLIVLLYLFFWPCVVCSTIYGFWLHLWYFLFVRRSEVRQLQLSKILYNELTLEETEEAIKNGQSRETSNIAYTIHMLKLKTNKKKSMEHISCVGYSVQNIKIYNSNMHIFLRCTFRCIMKRTFQQWW